MDRGLVTVTGTVSNARLIRDAADHATGADAELLLVSPITGKQYQHDIEVLNRIVENDSMRLGDADPDDMAADIGRKIAAELLSEYDVEYEVVGLTVDRKLGRRLVTVAESHDCDHVFLLSKPRSRFRGAVGEAAQTVLKRYDDPVTIARERDPERKVASVSGADMSDWQLTFLGDSGS